MSKGATSPSGEPQIDLNADMGEYIDGAAQRTEAALMKHVTSCSIACGGHTGDEETIRHTARQAAAENISIGAHPSYPDRDGFGRRRLDIDHAELRRSLRAQLMLFRDALSMEKIEWRHVKPHGALYNDAAEDRDLADIIVEEAKGAAIIGPAGSALEAAAKASGVGFAAEGFVDRLYMASGKLTPRHFDGAVITDIEARALQAEALSKGAPFKGRDGVVRQSAQTLCIHSDSPNPVETAIAIHNRLRANGVLIRPLNYT